MIIALDIQTLYLYGLIIGASITILYMLFGDIFEAVISITEIAPGSLLNPTVILSFISILSGSGFLFEMDGSLDSSTILIISTIISLAIVSLIHLFILVPLSKSEQSTAGSITDFIGQEGEVITAIPANGIGEVLILSAFGSTGNMAKSASNSKIEQGVFIRVIRIDEDLLIVEPVQT